MILEVRGRKDKVMTKGEKEGIVKKETKVIERKYKETDEERLESRLALAAFEVKVCINRFDVHLLTDCVDVQSREVNEEAHVTK